MKNSRNISVRNFHKSLEIENNRNNFIWDIIKTVTRGSRKPPFNV